MTRSLVRVLLNGVGLLAVVSLILIARLWRQQQHQYYEPNGDLPSYEMKRGPVVFNRDLTLGTPRVRETADSCWRVEPWYHRHYLETHLVFFGKPIMQAIRSICIQRRWKMKLILNDSSSGLRELENSLSPWVFTVAFTSSRALRHPLIQQLANSTNALVSGIRYAFKITGAKKGQLEAFREQFNSFGCTLEDADIMPRSFLMDNPHDCLQFFKYANSRPASSWVLKTSQGYGGDGITILPNLTRLRRDFGTCQGNGEYVVQEYLSNLLLVEGRKFDVRALVLIAGTTPYLLFHHDGYLRVSVKEFDPNGGRAVHLTNSHVQVISTGFDPEKHFWSFQRFQEYLDVYHPENGGFVHNRLIPFIKKTSLFILQAGLGVFSRMPSTFQFLGLDFMVTQDFHVWFIEANNYPLWPKGTPFIDDLMKTLGNDMFDMLFELRLNPERFTTMKSGEWYKSWELVWNEVDEECSGQPPYDACKEFL